MTNVFDAYRLDRAPPDVAKTISSSTGSARLVGQFDFTQQPAIPIGTMLRYLNQSAQDHLARVGGSVRSAGLILFRAVDAEDPNPEDMTGDLDLNRVAVKDTDDVRGERLRRERKKGRDK